MPSCYVLRQFGSRFKSIYFGESNQMVLGVDKVRVEKYSKHRHSYVFRGEVSHSDQDVAFYFNIAVG